MVGTAMNTVIPPEHSRRQVASASNRGGSSQQAPFHRAVISTLITPCTWCRGSTDSTRSAPLQPHAWLSASTCAASALCVQTAPLGRPVVPLVDRKSTRLNSSHVEISYAVFCLKKKKK